MLYYTTVKKKKKKKNFALLERAYIHTFSTYVRTYVNGVLASLPVPATTAVRFLHGVVMQSLSSFYFMCKHAVYLPLEAKNAVRFVKLYNLVHDGLELHVLLSELHASLLGATSFHMYEQYAYFWLGLASYMNVHVYMSYRYSLVITE